MKLNCTKGKNLWREAELEQLNSIDENGTFHYMGIGTKPKKYKRIGYDIVYAVKHDLHCKTRLVADGDLT